MSWEVGGWRHLGLFVPLPLEIHKSLGNMAFLGPFDILTNLQKFFLNDCDPSPLKKLLSLNYLPRWFCQAHVWLWVRHQLKDLNESSFQSLTYGPGRRVLVAWLREFSPMLMHSSSKPVRKKLAESWEKNFREPSRRSKILNFFFFFFGYNNFKGIKEIENSIVVY